MALGVLAIGACRGEDTPVDEPPIYRDSGIGAPVEGGSPRDSATPPPPPDAGPVDAGPKDSGGDAGPPSQGRLLASGELEILSTLLDGTIIFLRYGAKVSLEAIAPTGGTPTVIAPDLLIEGADTDDVVSVIGGAVGVWTQVDGNTGIGRLAVWTKVNGLKPAADTSPVYELDASADGARVAFVRTMGAEAQLVTAASTLAAGGVVIVQPTLGDGSATIPCGAFYTFVGQDLFSSTCSGAGFTATARRTTAAGVPLVIDTGLAPSFLSITATGDKVFTAKRIASTGSGGAAAVYSVGATAVTSLPIEAAGVAEGRIAPDGSAVVYRTRTGALKRAAATAPVAPLELLPNASAMGLLAVAPDFRSVLSHKLAPAGPDGALFDVQLSSTTAAGPALTLLPTATGVDFGFTSASKYALWVPDISVPAPVLKARAVTGGADLDLGPATVFLGKIDATDKVVIGDNEREITVAGEKIPVIDYKLVTPGGGAPIALVKAVDMAALVMPGGKQIAYTETGKGLFVKDVP